MQLDLNLLARLLAHGRVDEAGYPSGMDGDAPASHQDHLQTNGLGDNPLRDPSRENQQVDAPVEESEDDGPDAKAIGVLKDILKLKGIDMSCIALNDFAVLNHGFQIGEKTFPGNEIRAWVKKMTGESLGLDQAYDCVYQNLEDIKGTLDEAFGDTQGDEQLDEFRANDMPVESRFTYTTDTLGHVKVADAQTGKSVLLQGEDANEVLHQIQQAGDAPGRLQHVLAQYAHVMEDDQAEEGQPLEEYGAEPSSIDLVGMLRPDLESMQAKLAKAMTDAEKRGDLPTSFYAEQLLADLMHFKASLAG